jgi:cholesterol transport system auxiliary component
MRRLLVIACCLLLAGCYGGGRRGGDMALEIYDFGPPVSRLAERPAGRELAVEVRAPLWFDSLGIEYRLAYADPARLREYTRARWAGPVAQMVQQRLMQRLALVPAGQSRTRCVLRVDIDEFSQVFTASAVSNALLQARVQLLDRSRARLAGFEARIEKPADSADSRGGVAALTAAVDQLAADLLRWENELKGGGQLAACGA